MLKIDVEEPEGWVQRGLLLGGGPFVLEDRIIDLDVSHVKGSQLNIRLRPPKGFWAFNSFSVDYTPDQEVQVQTLHPMECLDSAGRDRLAQITNNDDAYYDMPNIGDRGYVNFQAPSRQAGHDADRVSAHPRLLSNSRERCRAGRCRYPDPHYGNPGCGCAFFRLALREMASRTTGPVIRNVSFFKDVQREGCPLADTLWERIPQP